MAQAVGSLETRGFPPVLAAADAMVKAGRVTLVGYIRAGSARFVVNIRGDVSEVKAAMEAGVAAAENAPGGILETWVIIPRPHENVVAILPIGYDENDVESFRQSVEQPILPGATGR
ncbi:carbon dioxide-concentrating mechanism protein CcmK [Leptolyngbya sp. PCC 6406]|uniref:carbon dioxide-concentrating mechanism protein CcmK n=1 Tax=Leptolyngbya sp. PCC 6406 TaxID=1173264 RepID=UPI0002AC6B4E|nr:carbon dioxide-concentrating mechanism protein CcmK [Leptolyngbya sp. PCC 6406]